MGKHCDHCFHRFVTEAVRLDGRLTLDECTIKELYNPKIVMCYFPKTTPMEQLMEQFWIMTHKCKNGIVIDFWKENFTTATSEPSDLALRSAVTAVWPIVFSQCVNLLNGLKDYSISLLTVDTLFKGKPVINVTDNITELYKGVELCQNRSEPSDFTWIHGVVERMNQFWQLCEFADAARVFLEVRDALNLTGDFQLVENVASQVRHNYADIHHIHVYAV